MAIEGSSKGPSNCLKSLQFGHKTYFEEVGIGADEKSGNGLKKNGKSPKCQVEGCKVDLSDLKGYYSKHKVCGIHSKSPLVIVAGLQQRFCQQCSRFHQLHEFDQGKRSCRRRLAGHNERRRKPAPGSLLSSQLGHLSSSLFGGSTTRSGFLVDFSSNARHSGKELWPGSKTFDYSYTSQDPPPEMYLQGSIGETSFSVPSGEYLTGISSDSNCALSLLSNETWTSRNSTSGTDLGNSMNLRGTPMSQCTSTQTVTVSHLPSNNLTWSFKGHEPHVGLNGELSDHLGLRQISDHLNGHFHSELFMDQAHDGRHYVEVDRGYSSTAINHVHWSL